MLINKLKNSESGFQFLKKGYKIAILLQLFLILGSNSLKSQDPEFSQFYSNPIYLNPAFTGTTALPKIHINFRDQWPSISHAYVSFTASYDQFFSGINSGISVIMLGDHAGNGIYQTFSVGAAYSYQIDFSDQFAVKAAFQGTFYQKRIDFSKIFFFDQINPITGFYDAGNNLNPTTETTPVNSTTSYGDINLGLLAFTERVFVGVTAKHINRPVESFASDFSHRLPIRYTAHAGIVLGDLDNDGGVSLSPNFIYTQQASFHQLTGGTYLKVNKIFGGLWYRYNIGYSDALIISVGVQTGILKTAYSYDVTLQDLSAHTGGAHEISIILNFDDHANANSRRALGNSLKCPSLF